MTSIGQTQPQIFVYPVSQHRRSCQPPRQRYRLKQVLRREFCGCCVYCRDVDTLNEKFGEEAFSVDHFRPKSKFPGLEWDYTNLFYACLRCNSLKSAEFPFADDGVPLLINPCDDVMNNHVVFIEQKAVPLDRRGRYLVLLLRLNKERLLTYRRRWQKRIIDLVTQSAALTREVSLLESTGKWRESQKKHNDHLRRISLLKRVTDELSSYGRISESGLTVLL